MTDDGPVLTEPYRRLLRELELDRYETHTVHDFYIRDTGRADKVNVVFRIDVDFSLEASDDFTRALVDHGLDASVYYLTDEYLHYDIWDTNIPNRVAERGFEVGLHTDHYFKQLTEGESALQGIQRDVDRLSRCIDDEVKGMVFHGHSDIDAMGRRNWDPYKHLLPADLGLVYHDGYTCDYADPDEELFRPQSDHSLTDYIGHRNAWQRYPDLPRVQLQDIDSGESLHLVVHPANAYDDIPETLRWFDLKLLARVHRFRLYDFVDRLLP